MPEEDAKYQALAARLNALTEELAAVKKFQAEGVLGLPIEEIRKELKAVRSELEALKAPPKPPPTTKPDPVGGTVEDEPDPYYGHW